ncbi:hypothetical protein [Acidovorax sp. NCPPB 4044]|uniref:hypothetical protein n=1 Tax=Acidovorax sp. NCPPB 4044 TaxID=2940490 RepID=UPI00230293A0|nr:hypothetical protein [Acidovorax sp. NCPPB 4044]MDA8520380.1 hypothetical protein [Acidovorax sp. NCPPB 4044]
MTWFGERRGARLVMRSVGRATIWVGLLIGVAVAINLLGIRAVGGAAAWEQWIKAHASFFMVWRIFLYTVAILMWRRLRIRLQRAGTGVEELGRIRRVEVAAVLAALLLEAGNL